jgi:uncharacterized protein
MVWITMKFEPDSGATSRLRITAYGPGHVIVAGTRHEKNVVIMAGQILAGWGPATPAQLDVAHLQVLAGLSPEVVLLGTGPRLVFPRREVMEYLPRLGIGLEFMDTGAACRAYNYLLADERRVAAALLLD